LVVAGCVMNMFKPVFILEVFWNVTWVTAKPAATISIGIAKATSFRYLIFMVEEILYSVYLDCAETNTPNDI
jgi:hypothetical protein